MKTDEIIRDTVVKIVKTHDDVCVLGENCPKHNKVDTMKFFTEKTIVVDSEIQESNIAIVKTSQKTDVQFASDTIKPCDVKLLEVGDMRLSSEFIVFPEPFKPIEQKPVGDAIGFGLIIGFMTYKSIKYAIDSFDDWKQLIRELRMELNS